MDTQGFPPYCTTLNKLSLWEEEKIKCLIRNHGFSKGLI
jgi:hypothetical protein